MYSRLELGPVHFPSGVAHISDPVFIHDNKQQERALQAALAAASFAIVNGTAGQLPNTEIGNLAGLRVPATPGKAILILDGDGQPHALSLHFAEDKRMSASTCLLQGFLQSRSGQVMVADLDAVIADYRERHVRAEDEEEMPFGYDLVCLNSARNDKRGSAFRGIAAVTEVPQYHPDKGLAIMAMVEGHETVGLFINL